MKEFKTKLKCSVRVSHIVFNLIKIEVGTKITRFSGTIIKDKNIDLNKKEKYFL